MREPDTNDFNLDEDGCGPDEDSSDEVNTLGADDEEDDE